MNYRIPNNLLSSINGKTIKGLKKGYETHIIYMSPFTENSQGINLCSHATIGCAAACLHKSGAARFDAVQEGKLNKTEYFLADRKTFLNQLDKEVTKFKKKSIRKDLIPTFRLNGTSDIVFEKFKIRDNKNIFELHPDVQFYDYTKNPYRMRKAQPANYHLTFSMSEDNRVVSLEMLNEGHNVAIVFGVKDETDLPKTFLGYTVINGDETDLRFLDDNNVIIGLKYKLLTGKGTKGVNKENVDNNDFIINVDEIEEIENSLLLKSVA